MMIQGDLFKHSVAGSMAERVDPFRLAGRGAVFSGRLSVADMPRLVAALADTAGEVAMELRFLQSASGRPVVSGHLSGKLGLRCQRCLESMVYNLDIDFESILVENEADEATVLEEGEPLLVTDRSLSLVEMVEDEILLAMPLAPRHGEGEPCRRVAREFGDVRDDKESPFAMLAELRGGEGK